VVASRGIAHEVVTDVVEYTIVLMPDVDSLAQLVPALAELFEAIAVRILDLVVLVMSRDGAVRVLEFEEVESMAQLRDAGHAVESLLSEHDIELAVRALRPGAAALVLLTEDRWAGPLSAAARRAGGEIVAGERIARSRMEAALAEAADKVRGGG
jgi:hypothetical protein